VFGFALIYLGWALWCVPIGERLDPIAAVAGGLIGAFGAAAAVYLTLAGQRQDDAEKVEAALRAEVAEFCRLALGLLRVSQKIEAGTVKIPMQDLPPLMTLPEAVVYRATADRISRLEYGPLLVTFHARISEAAAAAQISAASARPVHHEGMAPTEPFATKEKGKLFGAGWFDVCEVGQSLLRRDPASRALAEASAMSVLSDLDKDLPPFKDRYRKVAQENGKA